MAKERGNDINGTDFCRCNKLTVILGIKNVFNFQSGSRLINSCLEYGGALGLVQRLFCPVLNPKS